MSSYTFNGGTAAGGAASSWTLTSGTLSSSGLPQSGDTMLINGGKVQYATATILDGQTLAMSGGTIALCNPSNDPAQSGMTAGTAIDASGDDEIDEYGGVTNAGSIDVTAGIFTLLFHQEGSVTAAANALNTGTIEAMGGTLELTSAPSAALTNSGLIFADGGLIDVTTAINTAGTSEISANGTIDFNTTVPDGTVNFTGAGELILAQAAAFHGSVAGFATGDTIDLGSHDVSSLTYQSGVLTLDGANGAIGAFALSPAAGGTIAAGTFSAENGAAGSFQLTTAANGDELLTLGTAAPSGGGGTTPATPPALITGTDQTTGTTISSTTNSLDLSTDNDSLSVTSVTPAASISLGNGNNTVNVVGDDNVVVTGGVLSQVLNSGGTGNVTFLNADSSVTWDAVTLNSGDAVAEIGDAPGTVLWEDANGPGSYKGLTRMDFTSTGQAHFTTFTGINASTPQAAGIASAWGTDPANGQPFAVIVHS